MTRKRSRSESPVRYAAEATTYKRRRLHNTRAGSTEEHIDSERAAIAFWTENRHWPKQPNEQDESPLATEHEQEYRVMNILARKRSSTSLNARSQQASGTLSDSKPREIKATAYQDARYVALLATKNSYMFESGAGPLEASKVACQDLLTAEQPIPTASRFSKKVFKLTCQRLQSRNEAKVIQDISRLIVPSVEELVDFGAEHLAPMVESVNEGWNNCVAVTKPRPQPDYAVGFRREAFTQGQLDRMQPLVGDLTDQSMFMATYYMYFPFLTCEVKCGAAALDIADRQNAHSMTIALKAIVELFRLVKREQELHREILAFSISHDHEAVKIFGHYVELDGPFPKHYRYVVRKFDFTDQDGRDRWTAYKFVRNIYDVWVPRHMRRLCSAIDQIPANLSFAIESSECQSDQLQAQQGAELRSLSHSSINSRSWRPEAEPQSNSLLDLHVTPETSVADGELMKRPRRDRRPASKP